MSERYQAVLWNPQKKTYDRTIALGVALYVAVFAGLGLGLHPRECWSFLQELTWALRQSMDW